MSLYEKLKTAPYFFLIAGPCVIEEESIMYHTAEYLKNLSVELGLPLVFKSSYTKANRSSGDSFSGPGISTLPTADALWTGNREALISSRPALRKPA